MTNELKIRALEKEDIDFIHQMVNNPDIMSFWFEEAYKPKSQLEEEYMKHKDTSFARQFILEKNGERLGLVALYEINYVHRKAEFAIMIDPAFQGHGYATIATKLATDYAFNTLNLNKLFLIADAINEKAIHIYEKVGFNREAILKEEYFVKGRYHDAVIMSMFQDDFFKKENK